MRIIFVLISLILFTSCNTKSNSPKGIEQNNLSDTTAINNEEESDEEWYVNSGTAKPEMSDEEWEKLSEELPTRIDDELNKYNISWLWGTWKGTYVINNKSFPLSIYFSKGESSFYQPKIKNKYRDKVYYTDDNGEYVEGIYWLNDELNIITLSNNKTAQKYNLEIDFVNKKILFKSSEFIWDEESGSEIKFKVEQKERDRINKIHEENKEEQKRLATIYKQNNPSSNQNQTGNNSDLRLDSEASVRSFLNNRNYVSSDWSFKFQSSNNTVYFDNNPIGTLSIKGINKQLQTVDIRVFSPHFNKWYAFLLIGANTLKDEEGRIYTYRP